MKKFYKRFKELTGYNVQDMADKVGVSKQHIHKSLDNYSMVYRTSIATVMSVCIDDKVKELQQHIEELNKFKQDVILESIMSFSEVEEG